MPRNSSRRPSGIVARPCRLPPGSATPNRTSVPGDAAGGHPPPLDRIERQPTSWLVIGENGRGGSAAGPQVYVVDEAGCGVVSDPGPHAECCDVGDVAV